jgi:hypothetical protein
LRGFLSRLKIILATEEAEHFSKVLFSIELDICLEETVLAHAFDDDNSVSILDCPQIESSPLVLACRLLVSLLVLLSLV